MIWDKMDFLRCPNCDAESHHSIDDDKSIKKTVLKATKAPKQCMHVKSCKGGGSKNRGRSTAKEKLKKHSTSTLFQRLFIAT